MWTWRQRRQAGVLVTQAERGLRHSVTELVFGFMIDLSSRVQCACGSYRQEQSQAVMAGNAGNACVASATARSARERVDFRAMAEHVMIHDP